jgi:ectoine hydroxylase-related dioxygenase (phytanoyl-CoA dioxygenase family)
MAMPELEVLESGTPIEDLMQVLLRDGAFILKDAASREDIAETWRELKPYVEATERGSDEFTGFKTTRTGALVARSAGSRKLMLDETLDKMCVEFLHPNCARHQLHLGQVIRIMPGQPRQAIHKDRWAWGKHLQNVEPQLNTIWAVTEFTRENGATQVVPGSMDWPDDHKFSEDEIAYAEMQPGSALVYSGSVFHGGGENTTQSDRVGINITYALGWLRQEENQYLSCPPEIAKELEPRLQKLIGYTMGSYALGYYTPPLEAGAGPGIVAPEYALSTGSAEEGMEGAGLLGDAALMKDSFS